MDTARSRSLEEENRRLRDLCADLEVEALGYAMDLASARDALRTFVQPNARGLEEALWGDQPDSASMTITVPLGEYIRARAALSPSECVSTSGPSSHSTPHKESGI
jgi:hypothetical protein